MCYLSCVSRHTIECRDQQVHARGTAITCSRLWMMKSKTYILHLETFQSGVLRMGNQRSRTSGLLSKFGILQDKYTRVRHSTFEMCEH